MTENKKKLVELKNVSLSFNEGQRNEVKAIDNISFDIYEGEVFGLVGESGSGKTTVGRAILKLYDISKGEIVTQAKRVGTFALHTVTNFGSLTIATFMSLILSFFYTIELKKMNEFSNLFCFEKITRSGCIVTRKEY